MLRQIWVSPHKDENDWIVKKPGAERARHFENKEDAREYARDVARNQELEMIVQKKDGTIGEKNTYFKPDYCPPKG